MWLLFVDVEYGPDAKEWKERKKRRRAWHSLDDARAVITNIPDADRRPELAEMRYAATRRLASVVEREAVEFDTCRAADFVALPGAFGRVALTR